VPSSQLPKEFDLPPNRLSVRRDQLLEATARPAPSRIPLARGRDPFAYSMPRRLRRLPMSVAVGAAAILVVGGVATALVMSSFVQPPTELQRAMTALFPTDRCTSPTAGEGLVRDELDRLGYSEWDIQVNPTNVNEPCVYPLFDAAGQTVILVRDQTPEASHGIERLEKRLWMECFSEQAARDLIGDELDKPGIVDWSIQVDRSIVPASSTPEARARRDHMEAGCFVLVGSIEEESGPVVYLINGDI
jgi:hypothetical protein